MNTVREDAALILQCCASNKMTVRDACLSLGLSDSGAAAFLARQAYYDERVPVFRREETFAEAALRNGEL